MSLRFISVVCIKIPLLFIALYVCMYIPLFFKICLHINRQLGCFHFLIFTNKAIMITYVLAFLWGVFSFLNTGSVIAESYGDCIFNFIRDCQTLFQNVCIILPLHQQYVRVPLLPCESSTHYRHLV